MSANGTLGQTPLSFLVRNYCKEKQTVQILLDRNGETGAVYVLDGQVVHAQHGGTSGPEGFYDLVNWDEGTFTLEPDILPPVRTINLPWSDLLIQAAKRSLKPALEAEPLRSNAPAEAVESPESESELLEPLLAIPGVQGAVQVAPDGTLLNVRLPEGEGESEAALAVLVGGAADQLGDLLGLGSFEQGVVVTGSGRMTIIKDGESYFGMILEERASAALVLNAARRILEG